MAVREALEGAGFSAAGLCERLGVVKVWMVEPRSPAQQEACLRTSDLLAALLRLFVLGQRLPAPELETLLPARARESFLRLGLLELGGAGYVSPVILYPVGRLLVASDRAFSPEDKFQPLEDFVFCPNNIGTLNFLQMIPDQPVETFLDLGTGSGVAALAAEPFARSILAVDIAPRSAHFASFNARLNGCRKVRVLVGDLYGPAGGRQFELIVAHPPYVPALARKAIFRDGGLSGEEILKRCIDGLPVHLSKGGLFVMVCTALDTDEKNFEWRVREWLGESEREFDLLFGLGDYRTSEDFVQDLTRTSEEPAGRDPRTWKAIFDQLHAQRVVYGAIVIRRAASSRSSGRHAPWTERRKLNDHSDASSYLRLFRWRDRLTDPDQRRRFFQAVPRLAPDLKVIVTHKVHTGKLAASSIRCKNGGRPFPVESEVDDFIVSLINRVDGESTGAAIYEAVRASGSPEAFTSEHFIDLLATLVERGFVELDDGF